MKELGIDYGINDIARTETGPFLKDGNAVLKSYEQSIATHQIADIGEAIKVTPMYSGETPPLALREYKVQYPKSLIEGYKIACEQYDQQFMRLVGEHKIWATDYQYAPFTLAFQVDGPAYPEAFLNQAEFMSPNVLAEFITKRVFEFEANIAAYGLNGRLWPDGTTNQTWHAALEIVRQRTGKKVAVLAGTEEKLDEMVTYEMGVTRDQLTSDEAVRSKTGFDAFLGPNDLVSLYEQNQGNDCLYVFFGRTSRPKSWLRDPSSQIDEGFLANPKILKYVRAHAITHNFDDPTLPNTDPAIIMDTKEALVLVGAAYRVAEPSDIYSRELLQYLADNGIGVDEIVEGTLSPGKKNELGKIFPKFPSKSLLSESLVSHLRARGSNPALVASGEQKIRAKPLKQHYGIYGHEVDSINRSRFLNKLMEQVKLRGRYIIQPEFSNLHIVDNASPHESYVAIDRVFFVRGADGQLHPMESCRSLMPSKSDEGKKNNVHEGSRTKCVRIAI